MRTEGVARKDQQRQGGEEGEVGLHHQPVLVGLEELRCGGEVVGVLTAVLGGAGGVEDQVAGDPAHGEHEHDAPQVGQRSLTQHLVRPVGAGGGRENLVVLARASVVVVATVGDAPRVVRDQQKRVANGAHNVVGELALREGLVAALMRQHPNTSHNGTLHQPVQRPKDVRRPRRQMRQRWTGDEGCQVAKHGDFQ